MPEALEVWIGEGRPLDPSKYVLILPNHFGLAPTSSPSNTPPPFDRGTFPRVSIADDVVAQQRLVTEAFGLQELQLALGWSMGALQTYEWAVRFPTMVKRMAAIAGAPKPSAWMRLWGPFEVIADRLNQNQGGSVFGACSAAPAAPQVIDQGTASS